MKKEKPSQKEPRDSVRGHPSGKVTLPEIPAPSRRITTRCSVAPPSRRPTIQCQVPPPQAARENVPAPLPAESGVNLSESTEAVPKHKTDPAELKAQIRVLSQQLKAVKEEKAKLKVQLDEAEKLSLSDPLTGISNRRCFDQRVAEEHERMKRSPHLALSLIVIDIDHFKMVNDKYGHAVGDIVIKALAAALERSVRKYDIPARFGGEEFVVILPSTGEDGASKLAERIHKAVAALEIPVEGKPEPLTFTVSIGVRTHRATDGNVGMLFHEADDALYRAKHTGRNKICTYEEVAA